MSPATDIEAIRERLMEACIEEGLFPAGDAAAIWKKDLIDTGAIDSMGLLALEGIVEEVFGKAIPHEIMVAELRTLEKLAEHLRALGAEAR